MVKLKQSMKELAVAPFGDGRFEVFVDDERIYSKLETGQFPNATDIVRDIAARA